LWTVLALPVCCIESFGIGAAWNHVRTPEVAVGTMQ
jgi:hypothetical protein